MPTKKIIKRQKIRWRIRKKIQGTADKPRFAIYKSNKALYAYLIDDTQGHTLAAADTRPLKAKNCKTAFEVGKQLAILAKAKKIQGTVFDRSGYPHHGLVQATFDGFKETMKP